MQRSFIKQECSVCLLPVYADQGYHTCSLDHYDCHRAANPPLPSLQEIQAQGAQGDAAIDSMFAAIGAKPKRRRAKAGTGKLSAKVQQLVLHALEEKTGLPVYSANLWLQEGAYRGPRWDLDSWGVDAKMGDNGKILICCSSLAPMREYRSCKKVILGHSDGEDSTNRYDLSPAIQT